MIYLNNSAGTKPYPEVILTIVDVLANHWGNPHDDNSFGHDAQIIIDNVTHQVANDINCKPEDRTDSDTDKQIYGMQTRKRIGKCLSKAPVQDNALHLFRCICAACDTEYFSYVCCE